MVVFYRMVLVLPLTTGTNKDTHFIYKTILETWILYIIFFKVIAAVKQNIKGMARYILDSISYMVVFG